MTLKKGAPSGGDLGDTDLPGLLRAIRSQMKPGPVIIICEWHKGVNGTRTLRTVRGEERVEWRVSPEMWDILLHQGRKMDRACFRPGSDDGVMRSLFFGIPVEYEKDPPPDILAEMAAGMARQAVSH